MIGASSPLFSVWPFEEALEALEPHFELWEIVSEADHFIPDIYDKLKNVMETSTMKFQIHAPYSDINLAAFDRKTRDYSIGIIEGIVRLANELGIDMVTFHPGNIAPIQSYDKSRVPKYTRQSLELLDKRCADYPVTLAFENMPAMKYTICQTASELVEMIDSLNFKICFDVGHANLCDQMEEFLALKDDFGNVHLSDNLGDKDRHLALGKGNIDIRHVMAELEDYKGNYIIETRSLEDAISGKAYLDNL